MSVLISSTCAIPFIVSNEFVILSRSAPSSCARHFLGRLSGLRCSTDSTPSVRRTTRSLLTRERFVILRLPSAPSSMRCIVSCSNSPFSCAWMASSLTCSVSRYPRIDQPGCVLSRIQTPLKSLRWMMGGGGVGCVCMGVGAAEVCIGMGAAGGATGVFPVTAMACGAAAGTAASGGAATATATAAGTTVAAGTAGAIAGTGAA
mmetsp:Transcript_17903/g.49648  ORF Transcript_17903/g.49648 Transcript_17903/m.49648 type:complete len:204 (+) Transcript_17903:1011-1622(+)